MKPDNKSLNSLQTAAFVQTASKTRRNTKPAKETEYILQTAHTIIDDDCVFLSEICTKTHMHPNTSITIVLTYTHMPSEVHNCTNNHESTHTSTDKQEMMDELKLNY